MTLPAGSLVDRYRVERVLGRGGMGVVYLVQHVYLQSQHALKVLHRADARVQRRLLTEAQAQARLRHPHVVSVTDFIDRPDIQGFVMEYVEGTTLQDLLQQRPLTIEELDAIADGLFAGVGAAHAAGLLHRDLKPANVLLRWQGGRPHVLVCDFGLVRTDDDLERDAGVIMGTPGYISPEQLRGRADLDARADLFSLGALLYALCVGKPPFRARTLATLEDELHRGAPSPRARRPDLPDRIEAAIGAALQVDRRLRPAGVDPLRSMWSGRTAAPVEAPRAPRFPPGTHPSLEQLVAGGEAVQAHLATCARCRVALRLYSPEAGEVNAPPPAQRRAEPTVELPAVPPRRLGRGTTLFVGRGSELAAVRQSFGDHPIVSITGAPGVGKTRLAMKFLETEDALELRSRRFCNLDEVRTEAQLISTLATAIGRPCRSAPELGRVLAREGRLLLVLDPFEHLLPVASELIAALPRAAPELRVLITSRHPLDLPDEQQLPLDPLSPTDAARLFRSGAERRRRSRADWTTEELALIDRIVAELDGLPLAIELAAARTAVLSLEAIHRRLARRFKLLRGGRQGSRRHSTLEAAIGESWELLAPWEQAALAQCSVFRGSFSLEAAEEVLDLSEHGQEPLDGLDALRRHSLLQVFPDDRYALLHAVRDYAGQRLDETETAARHARCYAALVADAESGESRPGVAHFLPELDNLRAAFDTALSFDEPATALALATPLVRVFETNGPYRSGLGLVDSLLPRAGRGPGRARLLGQRGALCTRMGEYARAERDHLEALELLAEHAGHAALEGQLQHGLGVLYAEQTRYAEARGCFEAALEARQRADRPYAAARSRANLGGCLRALADPSTKAHLEGAVTELLRLGDRPFAAITQNNLALVYRDMGRPEEAIALLREAVAHHGRAGTVQHGASARTNLGFVLLHTGRADEAREVLRDALAVHRSAGNRRWELATRGGLALVDAQVAEGEMARVQLAEVLLAEVIAEAGRQGDAFTQGLFGAHLGRILADREELAEARRLLDAAVACLDSVDAPCEQGLARGWRAGVLRRLGELEAARTDLEEVESRVRTLGVQGARLQAELDRWSGA